MRRAGRSHRAGRCGGRCGREVPAGGGARVLHGGYGTWWALCEMADCPNSTPVDERSGGPEMEESIWTSPGPIPGKPTVMEIVCSVGAAVDLCSATPTHGFAVRAPHGLRRGAWSARSDLKMEHVDPGRLRISAARRQGDVHPARGWVRHRRQGRALGHSVDQAWCAAPAARMGPPLTESPGRCRVDERGSCGEPHGGHHAARCASCARAQGLAGTVRGIRCRHGVLLRRCASGAPSRHRGDAAGKDRADHCGGG